MRRVWWLWSACLLMVAPACSGSESSPRGDGASFGGLLQAVPDTDAARRNPVYFGNLRALRDGEQAASSEDDLGLLFGRSGGMAFLPEVFRLGPNEPEFADYLGFDTRQIEAVLEFGTQPDSVALVVGTISAGAVEQGLQSSPGGDSLVKEKAGDVTLLSLGEDDTTEFENVSPIRRVGQPLRMAVVGDMLYWGRTDDAVGSALDAADGSAPSLADDVNYSAVAQALDAAAVVNGIIVAPAAGERWSLAGLGETFQDDSSTVTIALLYANPTLAAAAVPALRTHLESATSLMSGEPWSQTLTVTEAVADGVLLRATLSSTRGGITSRVVLGQDNLLQF